MLSLIVAMDKNRVIGLENKLPWSLPADLKRFKQLTSGHHVVMGRKTFESIGKPLPGRTNVIITRQPDYKVDGCTIVHSLDAALAATKGDDEAFIIGGADLYAQALPLVDRIYITEVDLKVAGGDAHFPVVDLTGWNVVAKIVCEADDKNSFGYTYMTYSRKKVK